jgi:hypothetical protein
MAHVFRAAPEALAETVAVLESLTFSLDDLAYEYPEEATGLSATPQQELERLTWKGAERRYPQGVPPRVEATIRRELALIEELAYAPYFLTVQDIVRFARARGILARAAARRPIRPSVSVSASPRWIRRAGICCSSVSSRPSGASRRISTSTSSTSGARR